MAESIAFITAKSGLKVLLACASNAGADKMALDLYASGVDVVRAYAQARKHVFELPEFIALHLIVREEGKYPGWDKLKLIQEEMQVVATTCVAAYDYPVNELEYDVVIVEEADKASEQECLIPVTLCKGITGKLVLMSDRRDEEGMVQRLIENELVEETTISQ